MYIYIYIYAYEYIYLCFDLYICRYIYMNIYTATLFILYTLYVCVLTREPEGTRAPRDAAHPCLPPSACLQGCYSVQRPTLIPQPLY